MTTYSVSVTSHIPKKEGTCLLENTLGIFIHTGNRKPRKPQSRKRSLVSGCCQCFTPENEVMSKPMHKWPQVWCRSWRQSSLTSQEILEQNEKPKEGEKFLNHFWSHYWLYEHSETMVKMACCEFRFELKRLQEKTKMSLIHTQLFSTFCYLALQCQSWVLVVSLSGFKWCII